MLSQIKSTAEKNLPSVLSAAQKISTTDPKPLNQPSTVKSSTSGLPNISKGARVEDNKRILKASKPLPEVKSTLNAPVVSRVSSDNSGDSTNKTFIKESHDRYIEKQKEQAQEIKAEHAAAHERATRKSPKEVSNNYLQEISINLANIKDFLFKKKPEEKKELGDKKESDNNGGQCCCCKMPGLDLMDLVKKRQPYKIKSRNPFEKIAKSQKEKISVKKEKVGDLAKKSASKMGDLADKVDITKKSPAKNIGKGAVSLAKKSPVIGTAVEGTKGLFSKGGAIARAAGTLMRISVPAIAVASAGYAGYKVGEQINKAIEGTDIGKKKDELFDSIFAGIDKATDGLLSGDSKTANGMFEKSAIGQTIESGKKRVSGVYHTGKKYVSDAISTGKDNISAIGDQASAAMGDSAASERISQRQKSGKSTGVDSVISSAKNWVLGQTSKHFESGKGGAATVSTGKGDHGGVSYGSYQLSSKMGKVQDFLKTTKYGEQFKGLQAGSNEFNNKWKEVAKNDPEFGNAQHEYIKRTNFTEQHNKIKSSGIDLSGRGAAVQDAVWSSAVQMGGKDSTISNALKGKDTSKMSDADIVSSIQDYKLEHVQTKYRSSSDAVRKSVANRIVEEKKRLVELANRPPVGSDGTNMGDASKITSAPGTNTSGGLQSSAPINPGVKTSAQTVKGVNTANSMGLNVKGQQALDGGNTKAGTLAFAKVLQDNVSGIKQFTAFDDAYHHSAGYMGDNPNKHSAHHDGRAMDFTIQNPTSEGYAKATQDVRGILSKNDINAKVIDEKNHPSSKATAPHVHVQLASDLDVAKAQALYSGKNPAEVTSEDGKKGKEATPSTKEVAETAARAKNADTFVVTAKQVDATKPGEVTAAKGATEAPKPVPAANKGDITKAGDVVPPAANGTKPVPAVNKGDKSTATNKTDLVNKDDKSTAINPINKTTSIATNVSTNTNNKGGVNDITNSSNNSNTRAIVGNNSSTGTNVDNNSSTGTNVDNNSSTGTNVDNNSNTIVSDKGLRFRSDKFNINPITSTNSSNVVGDTSAVSNTTSSGVTLGSDIGTSSNPLFVKNIDGDAIDRTQNNEKLTNQTKEFNTGTPNLGGLTSNLIGKSSPLGDMLGTGHSSIIGGLLNSSPVNDIAGIISNVVSNINGVIGGNTGGVIGGNTGGVIGGNTGTNEIDNINGIAGNINTNGTSNTNVSGLPSSWSQLDNYNTRNGIANTTIKSDNGMVNNSSNGLVNNSSNGLVNNSSNGLVNSSNGLISSLVNGNTSTSGMSFKSNVLSNSNSISPISALTNTNSMLNKSPKFEYINPLNISNTNTGVTSKVSGGVSSYGTLSNNNTSNVTTNRMEDLSIPNRVDKVNKMKTSDLVGDRTFEAEAEKNKSNNKPIVVPVPMPQVVSAGKGNQTEQGHSKAPLTTRTQDSSIRRITDALMGYGMS